MRMLCLFFCFILLFPVNALAQSSVSPVLFFFRNTDSHRLLKPARLTDSKTAPVTVRFTRPPDTGRITELETCGLKFKRYNGIILHSRHIYPATVDLDSLESLAKNDDIVRIESTFRPSCSSTLDVSNPQVQASLVWDSPHENGRIDGSGIVVTNIDTGMDIYHPGFFKPDGGAYEWIDFNKSGKFESGIDCVDINGNGLRDSNEILCFFDAGFSDPLGLIERTAGVYDADIDWLYNDANRNGVRDFGPDGGYSENDPSFGELLFITSDTNKNNRLDPGERLTALGTSKIIAAFDKDGKHYRGKDLFNSPGDITNHGTGSSGIVGGQVPGRRFAGMAPGVEFISIDRIDSDVEEGILWAKNMGTDMIMYEFASWVYEFLDGTSNLEVLIDDLYDEGIHQFTASGNLAGPKRKKHARFSLEKSEEDSLFITVPDIGINNVYMSILWKGNILAPSITLFLPDSNSLFITGDEKEHVLGAYTVISGKDISPKQTNRMDILINSNKTIGGDMTVVIKNRRSYALSVDAYLADDKTHWMNGTQFQNYVTDDGTVCSPGTAEKGITVGAYDPRGTRNTKGDINDFSSRGDTIDGRRAVDITAPGTLVYSLTSHYKAGGQPGGYIDFGGTSAALPHVAGCASLILEASPGLSPDELSQVFFDGAFSDEFTGAVPNNIWGYGKLRVYDSLLNSNIITTLAERITPSAFSVSSCYPNPFNSSASFDITVYHKRSPYYEVGSTKLEVRSQKYVELFIYNILGQKVRTIRTEAVNPGLFTVSWDGKNDAGVPTASGLYLFRFLYDGHSISRNAVFLK